MEFTIHFDRALVRAVVLRYLNRTFGIGGWIAGIVVVASALYLALTAEGLGALHGFVIGGACMAVLCPPVIYVVVMRRAEASLKEMGDGSATVRLTEARIEMASPMGSSSLPWTSFKELWQLPQAWLLFVSNRAYLTLPLRDLSDEARGFIRARLEAVGAKIR